MVDLLQAAILALIQGMTEWLPVSSSGHLAIAQHFLGMKSVVFFDVMLHLGTLSAVCFAFRKRIGDIICAFDKKDFRSESGRMGLLVILASIPTAMIGFAFHDFFSASFENLLYIGIALLVTAVLLALTKYARPKKKLGATNSLAIGIAQGIAVMPGISRSGATISTGILAGIDKRKAAEFSFLLSIPAIIGAALFEARGSFVVGTNVLPIFLGAIVAALVGYAAIRLLQAIISKNKFHYFSVYCLVLGLALIALSIK
jgi:undecaprenyl-diphosphatase